MRRYIISNNRRFAALCTNQTKVWKALEKLAKGEELFYNKAQIDVLEKGLDPFDFFKALTYPVMNAILRRDGKITIYLETDFYPDEDNEEETMNVIATFSVQEVEPNVVIVDEEGESL